MATNPFLLASGLASGLIWCKGRTASAGRTRAGCNWLEAIKDNNPNLRLAMNQKHFSFLALTLCGYFAAQSVHAQGTTFTYQGRLNNGGSPVSGIFDLRFAIYDAESTGVQQGNLLTNSATACPTACSPCRWILAINSPARTAGWKSPCAPMAAVPSPRSHRASPCCRCLTRSWRTVPAICWATCRRRN